MTAVDTFDTAAAAPPIAEPAVAHVAPAVRTATRADEQELLRLLHLMHIEGGLLDLDVDRARAMFEKAFNREGAIIGVIGTDKIEGAIFLLLSQFWYSSNFHVEELFCFVDPNHRKSTHAKKLIRFAKDCARGLSVPLLIGVLSDKRTAAKVRLYRSQLGESAGQFFVFNSRLNIGNAAKPRVKVRAIGRSMALVATADEVRL
jgi:hypothetical protein